MMNYQEGMITGDAVRAMLGLPIKSQNYDTAIGMLLEHFGRKEVLINAHLESLSKLTIPSMEVHVFVLMLLFDIEKVCHIKLFTKK